MLAGRVSGNAAVGRALLDMVHSVPKMTPQEFETMFTSNVKVTFIFLSSVMWGGGAMRRFLSSFRWHKKFEKDAYWIDKNSNVPWLKDYLLSEYSQLLPICQEEFNMGAVTVSRRALGTVRSWKREKYWLSLSLFHTSGPHKLSITFALSGPAHGHYFGTTYEDTTAVEWKIDPSNCTVVL